MPHRLAEQFPNGIVAPTWSRSCGTRDMLACHPLAAIQDRRAPRSLSLLPGLVLALSTCGGPTTDSRVRRRSSADVEAQTRIDRYSCAEGFDGYAANPGYLVLSEAGPEWVKGSRSFRVERGPFSVAISQMRLARPLRTAARFWIGFWDETKGDWAVLRPDAADISEKIGHWFNDRNSRCNLGISLHVECSDPECLGRVFPLPRQAIDIHPQGWWPDIDGPVSLLRDGDTVEIFLPHVYSRVCVMSPPERDQQGLVTGVGTPRCYRAYEANTGNWWAQKYGGIFDLASVGSYVFAAVHGETYNFSPYPDYPATACQPNAIAFPERGCPTDQSGTWSSYFGTPSLVRFNLSARRTDALSRYQLHRREYQLGPTARPSQRAYAGARHLTHGLRHPTLLLDKDERYLYVFSQEMRYFEAPEEGAEKDRFLLTRVVLAPQARPTNSAMFSHGKTLSDRGTWSPACEATLCAELDGDDWATTAVTATDVLSEALCPQEASGAGERWSYGFKAVYVTDLDLYFGVESVERWQAAEQHFELAYRTSHDAVHWSCPRPLAGQGLQSLSPRQASLANAQLSSTQRVESRGFYLFFVPSDDPTRLRHVLLRLALDPATPTATPGDGGPPVARVDAATTGIDASGEALDSHALDASLPADADPEASATAAWAGAAPGGEAKTSPESPGGCAITTGRWPTVWLTLVLVGLFRSLRNWQPNPRAMTRSSGQSPKRSATTSGRARLFAFLDRRCRSDGPVFRETATPPGLPAQSQIPVRDTARADRGPGRGRR